MVCLLELRLLRAHVLDLAQENLALAVLHQISRFGNAKISDLYNAFPRHHYIAGANVAMDYVKGVAISIFLRMRIFESSADTADYESCRAPLQLPAAGWHPHAREL